MTNDLQTTVQVFHRKDGLINLYLWHPLDRWTGYKKYRDRNRPFINWIRKQFPTTLNEFRSVPRYWDPECGYGSSADGHYCVYGLTKTEYMRLKLSWTYKEKILHNKTRKGKPVKKGNFFGAGYWARPTSECSERFSRPDFKQKPLKI